MTQKPVANGMLTCEQIITEEKTRNITPVNCFSERMVTLVPSEPVPFVVFAILTDGSGEMALEVRIQRLDTYDEIYRIRSQYRFLNPLHEVRCIVRVRDCSFPVAGHYQITLLCENEMIAQRRMRIVQMENAI
jgi:hypothetical protein